jgi:hypothetical protein
MLAAAHFQDPRIAVLPDDRNHQLTGIILGLKGFFMQEIS